MPTIYSQIRKKSKAQKRPLFGHFSALVLVVDEIVEVMLLLAQRLQQSFIFLDQLLILNGFVRLDLTAVFFAHAHLSFRDQYMNFFREGI